MTTKKNPAPVASKAENAAKQPTLRIEEVKIDGWDCYEVRARQGQVFVIHGYIAGAKKWAELICRAVNNHDALLQACRLALVGQQHGLNIRGWQSLKLTLISAIANAEEAALK